MARFEFTRESLFRRRRRQDRPLVVSGRWRHLMLMLFSFNHVALARGRWNLPTAFASPSIPPPPSVSVPVWSLASPIRSPSSGDSMPTTSMNIVTFASPVSVAPPKLWIVSLYTNTLTRDAFLESKVAVLQLLTPELKTLVPILGKRSGYEQGFSKRDECEALGHAWVSRSRSDRDDALLPVEESMDLLPGCASYIRLRLLSTFEAGDHDVALCEVEGTGVWEGELQSVVSLQGDSQPLDSPFVLYTGQLRQEGII